MAKPVLDAIQFPATSTRKVKSFAASTPNAATVSIKAPLVERTSKIAAPCTVSVPASSDLQPLTFSITILEASWWSGLSSCETSCRSAQKGTVGVMIAVTLIASTFTSPYRDFQKNSRSFTCGPKLTALGCPYVEWVFVVGDVCLMTTARRYPVQGTP